MNFGPHFTMRKVRALAIFIAMATSMVHSFSSKGTPKTELAASTQSRLPTVLFESKNNNNDDDDSEQIGAWDENVDYEKEWPGGSQDSSLPDPGTSWDTLPNRLGPDFMGSDATELLGIDLFLEPLSAKDADRLREDARKIVEEAIDAGVNDIESLKAKMKRELDASRKAMSLASDLEAKRQSDMLMKKIDGLTGNFLKSTESSRKSTKMAAAASRAMEGTAASGMKAKGIEVGTWGVLGGRTVVADDELANSRGSGLLGSVGNAVRDADLANNKIMEYSDFNDFGSSSAFEEEEQVVEVQENRILIVADTQKDKLAKQLVPALLKTFEKEEESIANLKIDVLAPSAANMPLGGNDADCVIVFCTGLTQPDALKKILDRLLRKTIGTGGGKVGTPPTQLIGISTLGTERTDAFPYSVQNFMGGKLDTRRQIEEVMINTVRNRVVEPPLDYTIIKMKEGEFVDGAKSDFSLLSGDVLDDAVSIETATQVILQAVAYQPPARNSTISLSGSLPPAVLVEQDPMSEEFEKQDDFWRETFSCLDGPELWKTTLLESEISGGELSEEISDLYDRLVEYLREWADLLALSGKGLTTPIRAEIDSGLDPTSMVTPSTSRTLLYQDGVRLLFLPTNTGKKYVSREEELQREQEGPKGVNMPARSRKVAKEGGIDVVVEIANNSGMEDSSTQQLRIRARRTNYVQDAVIKEISEATIVKRLEEAIEVFKTDQDL